MKKFIAVLLLLSALAVVITSCGATEASNAEQTAVSTGALTDTETQAEPEALKPNLPSGLDYEGYQFNVIHSVEGWGTYTEEHIDFESLTGEVLGDAVYNRNRLVEEKLNFRLNAIIESDVSGALSKAVLAGDNSYDVGMVTYGWSVGKNKVLDFNTLPNIDVAMPWWNHNCAEQMSVGGTVTNMLSDFMITHRDGTVVMFYNKKLAADYNLGDFYSAVRSGEWTLEAFEKAASAVTGDLDGDGVYTDSDLFGYSAIKSNSYIAMFFSAGSFFTQNDKDGLPRLSLNNENTVNHYSAVLNLLQKDNLQYCPGVNKNNGGDDAQSIFRIFVEDRALFLSHGIGSAKKFRDMESDFGVIPMPKYDEKQENYANIVDAGKYMVIPKTAPDTERTGAILEMLSYEGYCSVIPAYYDTMLKHKLMRDEESIEMLDNYIFPNSVFKGFFYQSPQTMILSIKDQNSIASTIAKREEAIQKEIDKMLESIIAE